MIKTNVPQLRFSGFSGEWKQEKFNNFVKRISETSSSNQYKKIEFSDIDSGILKNKLRNNDSKGIKFLKKDVLFGKLRPYLKNWYYCNFDGIAIGDFWVYRAKKDYSNSTFIYYLIQTEKYNLVANYTTGTKMPRSDWNIVSNTLFGLPSFNEQQKIGDFFAKQDKLIELQTQKVDQLKKLKRGYLQKMFPQEGETVPRLRFSGFSGEWKEAKIEDIYSIGRGLVLSKKRISLNKTSGNIFPVYSSQTQNNGLLGYYSNYLYEDSITWTTDGANAGTVRFRSGKFYSTNVNGVLTNSNGYCNSMMANAIDRVAYKYVSHVGNPKLMNNTMKIIKIKYPSIIEQKKISSFINNIDHIIEEQSNKIGELKKQKKSYLQKMFV